MIPMIDYVIQTGRLGLRNWCDQDTHAFVAMNLDPKVMQFFPEIPTAMQSRQGVRRLRDHYENHGYTYFAVDELSTGQWIGFVGLLNQTYESPFTPSVDIGWRLVPSQWGQGFATEAASACLEFARDETDIGYCAGNGVLEKSSFVTGHEKNWNELRRKFYPSLV